MTARSVAKWLELSAGLKEQPPLSAGKRRFALNGEPIKRTVSKAGGQAMDNFSYMQAWHVPSVGFVCFFTHYGDPVARTSFFMTSSNGVEWEWTRLAAIHQGHYQISAVSESKAATAFNYHPNEQGLDHLYFYLPWKGLIDAYQSTFTSG